MEKPLIIPINDISLEEIATPSFFLDLEEEQLVQEIWKEEKLPYEGRFFHVLERISTSIKGCFLPYRLFLATKRSPELCEKMALCPLAVSGMTWEGDQVLIGQRSIHVTEYPLFWELAPSGGVEGINIEKELQREMKEELGIDQKSVRKMKPRFLIQDSILEIVFHIEIEKCILRPSNEYEILEWVSLPALKEIVLTRHFIPFTMELINGC